jgi:uncharacterized membrane protein YdjX (TVP38/TMEM64 family)
MIADGEPPRPRGLKLRTVLATAALLLLLAIGFAVAWFGGDLVESVVDATRALEGWVRRHPLSSVLVYFGVVAAVLLVAIPLGNVLLFVAAFLVGLPLALAAHVAAVLAVVPVHYGLAAFGLAGPVHGWAERAIAAHHSRVGAAVFDAAKKDGVATAVALRLGLAAPNAVTNVTAAILGVPLAAYLVGSALVVWMRPTIVAWLGSSLHRIDSAAEVTAAVAQAAMIALPLLVIPVAVAAWLARRHLPKKDEAAPTPLSPQAGRGVPDRLP